ncbi:MAG: tRNA (N(6)-L-threonylcarbamoyladenosine(37)-C(2))-methylthiotransferase MtaB, partial [Clostridiales bacterium]|nr:tRNA (N(6)-L-threonylcarbamoyladenosine(37)-C(2))-methylthiotransferase MtaB [Clostridiales bacterium]
MKTVAFHTLGCKVNQYDTQAMVELFQKADYHVIPFTEHADIYVLNTCTVTNTGDKKSLQLARRILRNHPDSHLVLAGCLSQRIGEELASTGARLIIGTQHRNQIVSLLETAIRENKQVVAVSSLADAEYEPLHISGHQQHTRAVMKIQEGCNRYCTYCIIPYVRGPIRSRTLESIQKEAMALAQAGFCEVVITGIHLGSFGLDLATKKTLAEILPIFESIDDIKRIRLGSLEPNTITPEFLKALASSTKICPQFHLALQSGSNTVLKRMGRRYTKEEFLMSINALRTLFPQAAFTTDVLTGFPGETEEEFAETIDTCTKAAFSHMHIFPYSPRKGTPAASFPNQITKKEKDRRVSTLLSLNDVLSKNYLQKLFSSVQPVLFEEKTLCDTYIGYTPQYVSVHVA